MEYSNKVFTCIFFLEFLLKFIGFGKSYFLNLWNLLDFIIICSAIFDIIIG